MQDPPLAHVSALVGEAIELVRREYGVELDLTPETLPLADGYLRGVVAELPRAERERQLVVLGVYFGEVMRRRLLGHWHADGTPGGWRVELSSCFLHFRPVGMAAETLLGAETEAHDGTFATLAEHEAALAAMLDRAPPMPEDEYYSLAGRAEVLAAVADWLTGLRLASAADDGPPPAYRPEDYAARLAPDRADS